MAHVPGKSARQDDRQREEDESAPPKTQLNLNTQDFQIVLPDHYCGIPRQLTKNEILQIYTGACLYKYHGKQLDNAELQDLVGDLVGMSIQSLPSCVKIFRTAAGDPSTVEVRRVATLIEADLLRQIDAVWRNPQPIHLGQIHRPVVHGNPISDLTLAVIHASIHSLVDDASQPLEPKTIQGMIYKWLNVGADYKKSLHPVRILADSKHQLTVKVAAFARRIKDRLIPECINLFEHFGWSGIQDRELASCVQVNFDDQQQGGTDITGRSSDDQDPSVAPMTQGIGSMNLGAYVQPSGLESSARGSNSGFAQPLVRQSAYPSNNPAHLAPLPAPAQYQYQYQYQSNNPAYPTPTLTEYDNLSNYPAYPPYPGQPSLGSSISPQRSAYAEYGTTQPGVIPGLLSVQGQGHPIDTNNVFGWNPIPQQPTFSSPYNQTPAQKFDSQSGTDETEPDENAVLRIGNSVFNSRQKYGQEKLLCSSHMSHSFPNYGAHGFDGKRASGHAAERYQNWQIWAKEEAAEADPDQSASSSSSSEAEEEETE